MVSKAINGSGTKLNELARRWNNQTGSTTKLVVEIVREAIVSGLFKAGEPLRQDLIAAELGVSKIPIREALRLLEAEGLVKFIANRGAVVTAMSLAEMIEMFELRVLLESQTIALAIPHLTPDILAQAEQIIEEAEIETDMTQWSGLNWRFHWTLYLSANRPYWLSVLEKLHTTSNRYIRLHLSLTQSQSRSQAEHRAILKACQQRNVRSAKKLLIDHLNTAQTLLTEHLSSNGLERSQQQI